MIFRFEKSNDKEEVVAYAKDKNELIENIERLCNNFQEKLIGYSTNGRIKELITINVECFYTDDDKIIAIYENEKYLVRKRLYELFELYCEHFVYINQGCLANISKIKYFDTSIGGTILVVFRSGYKDYVSRRKIKNVKERLGIR